MIEETCEVCQELAAYCQCEATCLGCGIDYPANRTCSACNCEGCEYCADCCASCAECGCDPCECL